MDIEYQNTYTQVLVENFDAVIKQNFQFQTQIRVLEKLIQEKDELSSKLNESTTKIQELENIINEKQIELAGTNELKQRIIDTDYILKEKDRIQIALNDYMQKYSKCEREFNQFKDKHAIECTDHLNEIAELKDYVKILESNVPSSKLKKLIKPRDDGSTF
uniref:Uncharacterized protein n=1 Tax=viral metagenome TaxID=1070528 RepID=A0A6C0JWJ9_9ZZZZ